MNEELSRERIRRIKDIFWILAFVGVVAMVLRFVFGLGATTELTDRVPWGLWKIFNMVGGAALATSGFTIGFLGHVLHIKKLERFVKPAIAIAFLGYGSSLFALLFDIGLPWRFWHPFVYWNIHSFLFEVFWCVSFYFMITFIELSPTLLERIGLAGLRGWLHKFAAVFVIIGITLSSMHHTSLGSLFLVTPQRLHALWYSPIISLLFIISAMGGGMMVLLLLKVLVSYWYEPDRLFSTTKQTSGVIECKACTNPDDNGHGQPSEPPDMPSLRLLATIAAGILGFYLVLKVADLVLRPDAVAALKAGTWESWLYGIEMVFGVVLPIIMVMIPKIRRSASGLAVAAAFAASGLALNRMNVGIFGYFRDAGSVYFPSAVEWAITVGVLSMAGLAFFFLVENFTVFNDNWKLRGLQQRRITSAFDRLTFVWHHRLLTGLERVTLIGVVAVPVAFLLLYPDYHKDPVTMVQQPTAIDLTRDTLLIDGNRTGVSAVFAHKAHQQRLGGDQSCGKCHHLAMPDDQATPCTYCHSAMETDTRIFDHKQHATLVAEDKGLGGWHPENQSCTQCHTPFMAKNAESAKGCLECHEQDMKPVDPPEAKLAMMEAIDYHQAMHQTCIPCHKEEAARVEMAHLGDCATCHYGDVNTLTPQEIEEESSQLASLLSYLGIKR